MYLQQYWKKKAYKAVRILFLQTIHPRFHFIEISLDNLSISL